MEQINLFIIVNTLLHLINLTQYNIMLENNNLDICRKLAKREFKFHRNRFFLLIFSISLVTALYLFSFLIGNAVTKGLLYNYKLQYGSMSHIIYTNLTEYQAKQISSHIDVKETVILNTIGRISDTPVSSRNVYLGVVNEQYAQSIQAIPITGRMPQNYNEIVLDEMTMNSLGIPHELGVPVNITWNSISSEDTYTQEFILCGYWFSNIALKETVAWVTEDFASKVNTSYGVQPTLSAGVTLYKPKEVEEQAETLLSDLGFDNIIYNVNLSYHPTRIERAKSTGKSYYYVTPFVLICGFLMIYNIIHISVESDIRFYGRLKALGMTPRQVRYVVLKQALILCIPSIFIGFILGFLLYWFLFPNIATNVLELRFFLLSFWPFLISIIFTFLTVLLSCWIPARKVEKISPAEAVRFVNLPKKRKSKTYRYRITLIRLAIDTLRRNLGRLLYSIIAIGCAMILLCSSWIRYISYDDDIYLNAVSISDYKISHASAATNLQTFNPLVDNITTDFVEALKQQDGVTEYGVFRTQEVDMYVSDKTYDLVVNFYENIGSRNVPRKDEMSYFPNWSNVYELFKKTKACKNVIVGADGLALEIAVNTEIVDGVFDAKEFVTGKYVISKVSAVPGESSNAPVGEIVVIAGREFTVMAQSDLPAYLVPGLDSPQAALDLNYILPMHTFQEMFPEANIRAFLFNIDYSKQAEIEQFLSAYKQTHNNQMVIQSRSEHQKKFYSDITSKLSINFLISIVLMLIGILSFINVLLTKTIVRNREFAMYESLGMTKRQLKQLLLLEGILHIVLLFIVLTPIVFITTSIIMPIYYSNSTEWAYTYKFSLAPLWISIPLFVLLAIIVPQLCLKGFNKERLSERMKEK